MTYSYTYKELFEALLGTSVDLVELRVGVSRLHIYIQLARSQYDTGRARTVKYCMAWPYGPVEPQYRKGGV